MRPKALLQAILLAFAFSGAVSPAIAATYTVTSNTDDSMGTTPGTLSWAITQSNLAAGNTIAIDSSVTSITVSGTLPAITQAVILVTTGNVRLINSILMTSGSGELTLDAASGLLGPAGSAGSNFSSWGPAAHNNGGIGGNGVSTTGMALTNDGSITGGGGGSGGNNTNLFFDGGVGGNGGTGGSGVAGTAFTLTNNASITGGTGGNGGRGGDGTNTGGDGGFGGTGGSGVSGTGFTLTNAGSIVGGNGGNGGNAGYSANVSRSGGAGGNGGTGVSGSAYTLRNSGSISGGTGGTGGSGTPIGAAGAGGAGVVSTGAATIYNSGTISGVGAANAIDFSGGGNKLVIEAGSVINGNVVSNSGSLNGGDTLALGGTANAGGGNSFDLGDIGGSAQYRGFVNFAKEGTATWTLTGAGTSDWRVAAGRLNLADGMALTGSLTVLGSGTLASGTASVTGAVANAGTLTIAAGETLTVGDFTNTGTFSAAVASMSSYGKLNVIGTAALGGALQVDATGAAGLGDGALTGIISAGNISGTFASYDTNSLLFTFTPVYSSDRVDLAVAFAAVVPDPVAAVPVVPAPVAPTILRITNSLGNTPAAGAAATLDRILANNPTGSTATLFYGFTTGQERQLSNAVSQTLPLFTGDSMVAAQSSLSGINRVIQARIESNRGLSSGDDFYGDKGFWLKPFGSWADQDDLNGVAGFKADTYGLAIGADGTWSSTLRVGAAFAYAKSDIDGRSNIAPQSADVDVYQLIGYGSYSLDERTEINFQADVGRNDNQGRRQIAFTSSVASSDYDSHTAHVGAGLGRTYPLSSQTSVTPSVRADYTWIEDERYSETGAGVLNLNVDSRSAEALIVGVDGKLAHQLDDRTMLNANLGIGYDTMNERAAITAAFAGAPGAAFVTYGIDPSPWLARGGLGAVYQARNGLEITARYDVEHRERFLNQTASAKLRWAF